ncbi:hypothetical protein [Halopseudomonas yangmingensis]|uniref:Uncharacterized protein n=1 Tax=Halopseudomonas yangmingensis TaxID=1720063 RepID=A0A1I4SY20_9GAMM|nr:hypothetical protein [Halopseudomonas yangmingensis]SFM69354.1 hypothetical protein SAMN05216217_11210 [Halopseudomonas yangmingensis]
MKQRLTDELIIRFLCDAEAGMPDQNTSGLGKRLGGDGITILPLRIAARRSTIRKMEDGTEKQILPRACFPFLNGTWSGRFGVEDVMLG